MTSRVRGGTTSTAFEAEAAFLHSLLEAVAARAGVSKMTVYSHFADKETTFETVVRAMSDEMMSAVSGPGQGAAPLRDRLNTVGIGFLRLILDPSVRMMGHTLSASLHKDQALARRFYDAGTWANAGWASRHHCRGPQHVASWRRTRWNGPPTTWSAYGWAAYLINWLLG